MDRDRFDESYDPDQFEDDRPTRAEAERDEYEEDSRVHDVDCEIEFIDGLPWTECLCDMRFGEHQERLDDEKGPFDV